MISSRSVLKNMPMKIINFIILSLFFLTCLKGQSIFIDSIVVSGNLKTKERVIFRELTFSQKQYISADEDLSSMAIYNENRLLSIGLFNAVKVTFVPYAEEIDKYWVHVLVNENWYLYPSPIFELADRNFNLWWYELNRDFRRVNIGLRGEHINLTGNRDKLSLTAQLGYTRKLELRYNFPFLDNEGKWSTSFNAFYADVREIAYATAFNKTQFGRNEEEIMLTRFRLTADVTYRKDLYNFHLLRFEYYRNTINSFVVSDFNYDYFLNGKTQNQLFLLNYNYFFDNREFLIFPVSGYYFHANLKKEGLYIFDDVNNLSLSLEFEQYFNFKKRLLWNYRVKVKGNLFQNQLAFAYNTGLGWGQDVIRGYEIYAIDGSDYAYGKLESHYKFYDHIFNLSNIIPVAQFNKLDVKLYFGTSFEAAYVNEAYYTETNSFNNRLIYGYGPTFSIMLFNTYLFQFDYSWNHTGEGGLFINNRISF